MASPFLITTEVAARLRRSHTNHPRADSVSSDPAPWVAGSAALSFPDR